MLENKEKQTLKIELRDIDSIRPYERIPWQNAPTDSVRDFAVYKTHYFVFRDGKIWSDFSRRFLKPRNHTHGYQRVTIKRRDEYIHRIVAACFVPNPNGYLEINHIDGNKQNNHADNLEWCTRSHNNKHAFATGLRDYAELRQMATCEKAMASKRRRRKYSTETVVRIWKLFREGKSDRMIAEIVGGTPSTIYQIRIGKTYREITDGNPDQID